MKKQFEFHKYKNHNLLFKCTLCTCTVQQKIECMQRMDGSKNGKLNYKVCIMLYVND